MEAWTCISVFGFNLRGCLAAAKFVTFKRMYSNAWRCFPIACIILLLVCRENSSLGVANCVRRSVALADEKFNYHLRSTREIALGPLREARLVYLVKFARARFSSSTVPVQVAGRPGGGCEVL